MGNGKIRHAASLLLIYLLALLLCNFIDNMYSIPVTIFWLHTKNCHIASFIHILKDIFYKIDGIAIFYVYVHFVCF